jgi:hypothetical protein
MGADLQADIVIERADLRERIGLASIHDKAATDLRRVLQLVTELGDPPPKRETETS